MLTSCAGSHHLTSTRLSRAFLDTLRVGSDSAVLAHLTPRIQAIDGVRDSIAAARAEFPPGAPDHVELVGGQAFFPSSEGVIRRALVYEFRTAGQWTVANLVVLEEFGILLVDGARVTRSPASLEALHRFTLEGKGAAHFLMFVLAVGVATLFPRRRDPRASHANAPAMALGGRGAGRSGKVRPQLEHGADVHPPLVRPVAWRGRLSSRDGRPVAAYRILPSRRPHCS